MPGPLFCEVVEPIARMLDRASERHPIVLAVDTPPMFVRDDGFAVLTVADWGIGIPADARGRVFDLGLRTADARDTGSTVFTVRAPIAAAEAVAG